MKRQRNEQLIDKQADEQFYKLSEYAYGIGWCVPKYVRLQNETQDPLTLGTNIEVLWPNAQITKHTINELATETVTGYEPDAYIAYEFEYEYPCIDICINGTTLKRIKLHTIKDIKVRIITKN